MASAARALVLLMGLAFLGIALASLVAPASTLAQAGVGVLDTPAGAGIVELRAMYGGLQLGLAAYLIGCAAAGRAREGLAVGVCTIGGLGLVRLIGLVIDGPEGVLMPAFAALELTGAALGAAALWRLPAKG